MPTDHEPQREIAYWQDLLTKIAQDLEHAAGAEQAIERKSWLQTRAMRIRKRLHDGMPADYVSNTGAQRMNPQS